MGFFKNYANQASNSASTSNTGSANSQANFFDRFPAPNIQPPRPPVPSEPLKQDTPASNPNETAEEKRKR